ncbi:MAG: helix-turn-helix domain-containing protein [Gemmatimonadetes bacterium]|nr:helix-turn-helix domain-containing protein [Gemmatimonadota bacterium]
MRGSPAQLRCIEEPGRQSQRAELVACCEEQDWNVDRVAVLLGVHRATLYRRLKRLGIQPPVSPAGGTGLN